MKVLYVGNAQGFENAHKFYLFPQRLINGFTRIGHTVYIFNDRDVARYSNIWRSGKLGQRVMNEALLQTCKDYAPELIILGHCERVTNTTLEKIYETLPEVKIIYRNVDPLDCDKNRARIIRRSQIVDGVFITTAGDVLKEFSRHKAFAAFLPNPVDASLDTGKAHERTNCPTDLFFAASALGSDDRRKRFIEELLPHLDKSVTFNLIGAGINDKRLFGAAFIQATEESAMGLILNKTEDFYLYASDRMSQYLGNGLLTLCPKGPRYTDIFDDGEVVEYEDAVDLAEKILYFKKHPQERMGIALKSYTRAHRIFNVETIAHYIIDQTYGTTNPVDYEFPSLRYQAEG